MRDITLGETIYLNFTTRQFSDGVPTVLAGSQALSVLEENNATPITAGVSVLVDRASVGGLNQGKVIATAGNNYGSGKGYCVYISTGTVGGVSVIGEVVYQFTIEAAAVVADVATAQTDLDTLTDARGEPGSGAWPVSASSNLKLDHLYQQSRNKSTSTNILIELYSDGGSVISKRTISEDGTIYTEQEIEGP